MSKTHMRSSIDAFLKEEGTFEKTQAQANKEVVAWQLAAALLHESSLASTMPTDRILTCRCGMTLVGRGRSSD